MNFLENISVVWQKLNLVQRAMLIAILVAGGITAVFLTKWASKPDMRPLYSGVSDEDAGKIIDKLAEKGILYDQRGTGNIYVPKEHVYQLRADLAKDGLPGNGSKGYGLFDKDSFGSDPFKNRINELRAVQDEIAMSIQMLDTISSARVHIVQPEQNPWGKENTSTASVILKVKPGFRISQSNAAAIIHMVAGGVEGLTAEAVTLVDNQGNLISNINQDGISGSANAFMDYKERTEQRLATNIQSMLESVLGPGRSNVIVSAEVDMDSEVTRTTKFDKGITKSETIESTTETKGGGFDANGKAITPDENTSEIIKTETEIPETITEKTKMAGKILSVSVACVVDLTITPPAPEAKEGEKTPPPPTATKIMQVDDVKKLIASALGKDLIKDENLSVVDTPFNRPQIPEPVKEPWHIAYIGLFKQGSLGLMAVCALIALKIFSGKVKPSKGGGPVAQLPSGGEGAVAALPAGDMRDQIAIAYKSDPEQVKELFTSWIEEKG